MKKFGKWPVALCLLLTSSQSFACGMDAFKLLTPLLPLFLVIEAVENAGNKVHEFKAEVRAKHDYKALQAELDKYFQAVQDGHSSCKPGETHELLQPHWLKPATRPQDREQHVRLIHRLIKDNLPQFEALPQTELDVLPVTLRESLERVYAARAITRFKQTQSGDMENFISQYQHRFWTPEGNAAETFKAFLARIWNARLDKKAA